MELSLLEQAQETVSQTSPEIEQALQSAVFSALDQSIRGALQAVTLADLVSEAERYKNRGAMMYYI